MPCFVCLGVGESDSSKQAEEAATHQERLCTLGLVNVCVTCEACVQSGAYAAPMQATQPLAHCYIRKRRHAQQLPGAACQPACSFTLHTHARMKMVAKLTPLTLLTDGMDADWLSAAKLTLGPSELLDGWPAVAGAATAGVLSAAVVPAGKAASLPGLGLGVSPEARALLGALAMPDTAAMPSLRVTVRANGRRSRVSRR